MRLLAAAALALLLSGCTAPEDEGEDPLFGLCPQWTQGPGGQTTGLHLTPANATQERELGPAEASWSNHSLDMYRVRIVRADVAGRVEMRAYAADGKQLAVRDYRGDTPQLVPVVHVEGGDAGREFDVFLSPATHGSAAAPTPARLGWTLDGEDGDLEYAVTFHYKVCGA